MLLRQVVESRKLCIIRKLLNLGLSEMPDGRTLDQLTLTELEDVLQTSLDLLEEMRNKHSKRGFLTCQSS